MLVEPECKRNEDAYKAGGVLASRVYIYMNKEDLPGMTMSPRPSIAHDAFVERSNDFGQRIFMGASKFVATLTI